MNLLSKINIETSFKNLQDDICSALEKEDGREKFKEDIWNREEGGGGRTRVISQGEIIEKGGVLYSSVFGNTPEKILNALKLKEGDFYATGVSIVIHPKSPMVPIIHMNIRYFEMTNGSKWFGGGIDLTPHYVNEEDAKWFHRYLKNVCDQYNQEYYPKFKTWADDYFYIKHRKETRGIGGIFFDRLTDKDELNFQKIFDFVLSIGKSFIPIYSHYINNNKDIPYSDNQKKWQYVRRGRYVEFNLVYDKGTKFGLDTNGRTESILMSMPPRAEWEYNYLVKKDSAEEMTLKFLKKGIDWAP